MNELISLVQYGDIEAVERMIENHPESVNQMDETGNTPLRAAMRSRNYEIAKMLIRAGADPHIKHNWLVVENGTRYTVLEKLEQEINFEYNQNNESMKSLLSLIKVNLGCLRKVNELEKIAESRGYPDLGKHFFYIGAILKHATVKTSTDAFSGIPSFHNIERKEVNRLLAQALERLKDRNKFDYLTTQFLELAYRHDLNPNREPEFKEDPAFHLMAGYVAY